MDSPRALLAQFARFAGLLLILAGGVGVSVGYVGGKDAQQRLAAASKVEVRRETVSTAQKKIIISKGSQRTATAARKKPAPATQQTRRVIEMKVASPKIAQRWRRMIWWGGGAIGIGIISVGWSLYERPPQAPRSGADEMLNEPVPF